MSKIKLPFDPRLVRTKLKMNQQQFWSRVGLTQSAGSRFESGRNIPEPAKLLLIVAYGTAKHSADTVAKLRAPVEAKK